MYLEYIDRLIKTLDETQLVVRDVSTRRSDKNRTHKITGYEQIMESLIALFINVKANGKCVFFIGNGGSAAIASHMTADFMKNGGMNTVSLYDNSLTTCMGNDYGYQEIFSRPLSFVGKEDDLLVAISSSGNSQNIINAVNVAHKNRMKVLTFTGFDSKNRIRELGDSNLYLPISEYGIVETLHCLILQQVVDEILKRDGVKL